MSWIRFRRSIVILAGVVACGYLQAPIASAEDNTMPSEVGLQFGGVLPHDSTGNGITDHSNRSGGYQATYTLQMNKWTAADADFGQTRYTQNFSGGSSPGSVQSNLRQLDLDFLLRIPDRSKRIHAYALTGVGMFRFSPTSNVNNLPGVTPRTRAAGIFGVGADFDVSKRIGVRADYRLARFKAPDFNMAALDLETEAHVTQPSIGVYFRFGGFGFGKK